MNDIRITVQGNLGADPQFFESEGKTPFAKFRLGSTAYRGGDESTQWFTVKAFKDLAKNCAASLEKGSPVLVRGRLESEEYDVDGVTKVDQVIRADAIGVDLRRGTVSYEKNPTPAT